MCIAGSPKKEQQEHMRWEVSVKDHVCVCMSHTPPSLPSAALGLGERRLSRPRRSPTCPKLLQAPHHLTPLPPPSILPAHLHTWPLCSRAGAHLSGNTGERPALLLLGGGTLRGPAASPPPSTQVCYPSMTPSFPSPPMPSEHRGCQANGGLGDAWQ